MPVRSSATVSHLVAVLALPVSDSIGLAVAGLSAADGVSAAIYGVAVLLALQASGLHRLRICLRVADQAARILAAVAISLVVLIPFLPTSDAAGLALVSAGLVVGLRLISCSVLRFSYRRGKLAEPTLVIGSGTFGAHVAGLIRQHPELGLRVRGFLDNGQPRRDLPEPSLGRPEDLAGVVEAFGIRRVIICFGDWRDEDLVTVLRTCRGLAADVCVVPRLYETGLAIPRGCLDEIWGIPLIPLRRIGHGGASRVLKRTADISLAAILLTVAMPLLLVLAAAIRLQSGESPLFRQQRVTGAGRQSTIIKLKTITGQASGASDDAHGATSAAGGFDSETNWAIDTRQCSTLGRWLRATHLDELPQLVNVLRGDMSLVGPRPERGYFADQFAEQIPRYADRDRMRAGLTGWAQVHGLHGDTSIVERSRFDNQYIEYWSPWLDLVILARTIGAACARPGADR